MAIEKTEGGKRAVRIKRAFIDDAGNEEPRVTAATSKVELRFVGLGKTLVCEMAKLSSEVLNCAAAFGLSTAIGNAAGQIRDDAQAFDACESRLETLLDGQWAADSRTGPRTADLVEAWARYVIERGGNVDDAWRAARKSDIVEGKKSGDELLGNKKFKAHYEAVKFEKAQAAMQAAQAEANSGDDQEDDSILV